MYRAKYYPWQIVSRAFNLDLACRLPLDFDVAALQSEVSAILKTYDLTRQFGKYHDGGWKAISLMAGGGDYRNNRATTEIQETEPLRNSPYLSKVIESFAVPTERVRLMQLGAGKRIRWHYEGDFLFPGEKVRLHVPIITNDGVRLQIGHQDQIWRPGELWFGDFSFPHRVANAGTAPRIHLIMDLKFEGKVRSLFPARMLQRAGPRKAAQYLCRRLYTLCTLELLARRASKRFAQFYANAHPERG